MDKIINGHGQIQPYPAESVENNARSLDVLADLIKIDIANAEQAGFEHYRAAGEKLIEARSQLKRGEFMPWVKKNFDVSHRQATNYIKLAETNQNFHFQTLPIRSQSRSLEIGRGLKSPRSTPMRSSSPPQRMIGSRWH